MKPISIFMIAVVLAVAFVAAFVADVRAATVAELEQQLRDTPASLETKEALAEAYLVECDLEQSLELWREILQVVPGHQRAQQVVTKLTLQALDLDSHLDVLERLIDGGIVDGMDALLGAASKRAATNAQKAHILYLRGALGLRTSNAAAALANFRATATLYADTAWGGRSMIANAKVEAAQGRAEPARRLLDDVIGNPDQDAGVVEEARFERTLIDSKGRTPRERIAALRALLAGLTDDAVKRRVLGELMASTTRAQGEWTPEAVEAAEAILRTTPPADDARVLLATLARIARETQDAATLDRLLALFDGTTLDDAALAREAAFIQVETRIARAVVEQDAAAMRRLVGAGRAGLESLAQAGATQPDLRRIEELLGRSYLVEAQKLVVLEGTIEALPALLRAKEHYLALLPADPVQGLDRLRKIATLLEHVQEWEMAVMLQREIATRFPHRPEGRDALLKVGWLLEKRLDAPMEALDVYAEYAARYPAELPYRQLDVGERLRRLGYANVLDFQKRNRLTPDGDFGPATRAKLEELEASFDMIASKQPGRSDVLRGAFVHPTMFATAQRLEKTGRHHDAIVAYRLFLNLFPTKREADDALISIARLFRDNLLFAEALAAYQQLIDDFPKGDKTSLAYIEAAECLENLGHWKEAKELYELYVRNFPEYNKAPLARERLRLLDEIEQYAEFIAGNPDNPKLAEAQYQIAAILYKHMGNCTKGAVEFAKVAGQHPDHVRAADALFTAGTAQLHVENFPAARDLYARLAKAYPESRLADDAQYWIGHTYEYSARALGKLDAARIVLKRRSLRERVRLQADLDLRRQYNAGAAPGPELPEAVWGGDTLGVLASGSVRDRVNADLFEAIRAYRAVVDTFKMGDMAGDALLRIGTIYTDYLKDPDKGIAAYRELLDHYPGSKAAVDALYAVGDHYVATEEYAEAIKAYEQFAFSYPQHDKVEDAMIAVGRCHSELKDWHKALDAYQSHLSRFPNGRHAEAAKAQIDWIRMYHF